MRLAQLVEQRKTPKRFLLTGHSFCLRPKAKVYHYPSLYLSIYPSLPTYVSHIIAAEPGAGIGRDNRPKRISCNVEGDHFEQDRNHEKEQRGHHCEVNLRQTH